MAFCTACGHDIAGNAFCTRCGARAGVPGSATVALPVEPAPPAYAATPPPPPPPPPPSPVLYAGPRSRWTPAKGLVAFLVLLGLGSCGFLGTYFLVPVFQKDNTIPPAPPQLAASLSQSDADAPATGSDEGTAWAQLTRIAAQDRAALQSTQQWRAQLASSPATESAIDVLASYHQKMQEMPNSLLAWSGDWPASYGPSSRHSWVILSSFTDATTRPILGWCASGQRGCWAKRLSDLGTPDDNTDHPPADPSKN